MSVPARLTAFAVLLVVAFGTAFGVGAAVGPLDVGESIAPHRSEHPTSMVPADDTVADDPVAHDPEHGS